MPDQEENIGEYYFSLIFYYLVLATSNKQVCRAKKKKCMKTCPSVSLPKGTVCYIVVNLLLVVNLWFLAVSEKHVIFVTLCSDIKHFKFMPMSEISESAHTFFTYSLSLPVFVKKFLKVSFFPLHSRFVSYSQRGLQSPVYCGTRERGCVFLSPWASPGLQQQDLWGGGLLQPTPEVQPGVWAVQDHSEVFLLSGVGAGPRRRQLSQHR